MKTTYLERFTAALMLLTNSVPFHVYVIEWLADESETLQSWASENGPKWAQGLAVTDAAHALAQSPVEGEDHEDRLTAAEYKAMLP